MVVQQLTNRLMVKLSKGVNIERGLAAVVHHILVTTASRPRRRPRRTTSRTCERSRLAAGGEDVMSSATNDDQRGRHRRSRQSELEGHCAYTRRLIFRRRRASHRRLVDADRNSTVCGSCCRSNRRFRSPASISGSANVDTRSSTSARSVKKLVDSTERHLGGT